MTLCSIYKMQFSSSLVLNIQSLIKDFFAYSIFYFKYKVANFLQHFL